MKYSNLVLPHLLLLVIVATTVPGLCQAFVVPNAATNSVTLNHYQTTSNIPTLWSVSGDDNVSTKSVKQDACPDCDLCDGSGR